MPLSFPPTPHQWLRLAQLLCCGAAAMSTVALGWPGGKVPVLRVVIPLVTFFLVACATRFLLEETESRLQMAAFAVAALILEALRSRAFDTPFVWWRWGLNTAAAVAGVLLAKHMLEPGSIREFIRKVIDLVLDRLGA